MRFASVDTLLAADDQSNAPDVRSDLACWKIPHEGGRAKGIVARHRLGVGDVEIHAESVVVAAGVVGTPKLIAGSHIDAGPALGAYLFDHPAIGFRVVLRREIPTSAFSSTMGMVCASSIQGMVRSTRSRSPQLPKFNLQFVRSATVLIFKTAAPRV